MEQKDPNMQKYENYREQTGRLKKALQAGFYLEAIFIEYAILEDRIESVLRHSGKFNPDRHTTLNKKLNRLKEMQRQKNGLVRKYFSDELLGEISAWKEDRNVLIHALMKQTLHTEDLKGLAERGHIIIKTLNSKSTLYNRYLERHGMKE
ncbi:MAG: hypothetical protein LUH03_00200 [Oscillospiraceae bacterium]|nr:hypothetical protein [Oscillospiraceae bacterium]